ncbi:Pimeloyl-ACP methyl ester carboxylesterase [Noviherbaspirillum humi]|uniref:Pimeloyl-ACP methyl ester carboxylesterase n=1 Tax=Noviherbaspirillum humi TaxID=1688639 RepID=A0A239LA92_9BURK|nr:alpha/beta hydrolase [Noviherbaspirillum humi]SNT27546.1 Pimeloyl-ACP methyl ester carboxylesterase [Noviherbaspirillum humi]
MKTLYLLCGLLCDSVVWEAQARALRSRYDVRVVSFEGLDSFAAMAEKVLADAPQRFALAGHSMGGRVAMEVYRRAPERFERLMLLDTGYEGVAAGEAEKRGVMVDLAKREGIDAIAGPWGLPMLSPAHREDKALVKAVFDMVGRMSPEIYARQTNALLTRPDATSVLESITCPTMIVCGMEDGWSPPARHEQMAKHVPHCELRLIDDCGHMAMMEQPEAILKVMEEWLEMPVRS